MAIKCKTDIKQGLIKSAIKEGKIENVRQFGNSSLKIDNKDFPSSSAAYKTAEKVKNSLNEKFKEEIATRTEVKGGQEIKIKPSDKLINEYYNKYLEDLKKDNQNSKTVETPFSQQKSYFNKRIRNLENELKNINETDPKYLIKQNEIDFLRNKLETADLSSTPEEIYKELGDYTLDKVEDFIKSLEDGNSRDSFKNIQQSWETIRIWMEFDDLRDQSWKLFKRLIPFSNEAMVDEIQKYSTKEVKPTLEDINNDNEDIRTFRRWTGSLSDLPNYIASTIGSIIRNTQNKVETKTKELGKEIQKQVSKLDDYAKKNGATLDKVYDILTQKHRGTLILAKQWDEDGNENPNWNKIQNTKELKEFYDFYQKTIEEAESGLPIKLGKYFIPNIKKSDLKSKVKRFNPIKTRTIKGGVEEENISDIIPLEYHKQLSPEEKSNDLATSLFEFGKFAANYKEMSSILPEVRVLQEQLKYKMIDGRIQERRFIKPSNPNLTIAGEDSNIYKIVDDIIEMQVKGKMKSEQGNYTIKDFYDENGNRKQEYIDVVGAADMALKFNSLLRIGFSPIGAVTNWLFGDISNLIEGFGSQFFTNKGLVQASNIFIKQNFNKESIMNKLLIRMNFLQELDDYEIAEKISKTGKVNKLSSEKLLEYMYSLQKAGEKFLQSRTGLAVMIKDGYLTTEGELTDKYNNASDEEIQKLIDKIQRLNQKIHGRYTQKEAAAAQQNVVYRLVSQFRKWIPSLVENRLNKAQWDNRLQADIEGTYVTFGRLVVKNWRNPKEAFENLLLPLFSAKKLLEEGRLTETEIANMRKMMVEIITASAMILFYAALHGGDDDKDKKFRKLASVKLALTLLDRASGDLTFFYSPEQLNNLAKNAIPLSKTMGDIIQATTVIPEVLYSGNYKVKSGSHKGQYKIAKEFSDITPLIKPLYDLRRIANETVNLEEQN